MNIELSRKELKTIFDSLGRRERSIFGTWNTAKQLTHKESLMNSILDIRKLQDKIMNIMVEESKTNETSSENE